MCARAEHISLCACACLWNIIFVTIKATPKSLRKRSIFGRKSVCKSADDNCNSFRPYIHTESSRISHAAMAIRCRTPGVSQCHLSLCMRTFRTLLLYTDRFPVHGEMSAARTGDRFNRFRRAAFNLMMHNAR